MIKNDQQHGLPFIQFRGLKTDIEALTAVTGGMFAFGWDTDPDVDGEYGRYDQVTSAWVWGFASGGGTVDSVSGDIVDNTDPANPVINLPVATTTTIGGVKRNTGAAGEYVTGIDASGNLEYDTPAGGGAYTEGAHVYNSAAISVSRETWTDLTFNSERWDTDTCHDTSINTQRLTCNTAGKYLITGAITIAANASGTRTAAIYKNGTTYLAVDTRQNLGSGDGVQVVVAVIADLAVNDYVTLRVYHNSTAASLNVSSSAQYSPEFAMQKIG